MKKDIKKYEPPSMKVYRFTDQDKVLTESGTAPLPGGGSSEGGGSNPNTDYAANALNQLFNRTSTTIEK